MASIADLFVRIGADIQGFTSGLSQASQQLDQFLKNTETSLGDVAKAGLALGAVGASITGFLALATRDAAEAAEAQTKLAAAIERSSKAIDVRSLNELAQSLQQLTRFSAPAIAGVQQLLIQFGATGEQVKQLTPLILDVSRSLGRDLTSTAEAFGRALTGNTGGLQRFIGVLPSGVTLSEDFASALQQLQGRFGGFARDVGQTLPDALLRLQNSIRELLQTLGGPFVGPITAIANGLGKLAEGVKSVIDAVPGLSSGIGLFLSIVAAVALATAAAIAFAAGLGLLVTLWPAIVAGVGLFVGALTSLVAFIAANSIGALIVAGLAGLIVAIPVIIANFDKIKLAFGGVVEFFQATGAAFAAIFRPIIDAIGALISVIGPLLNALRPVFAGIVAFIQDSVTTIALSVSGLIRIFTALILLLQGDLTGAAESLKAGLQDLKQALLGATQGAEGLAQSQGTLFERLERGREALDAQTKTLDAIAAAYDRASKQAEIFGLKADQAALAAARSQLARPGLNEQQLKNIQERLADDQSRNQQRLLRDQIQANEQRLRDTIQTAGRGSKAVLEVEQTLQQQRTQLEKSTVGLLVDQQGRRISRSQEVAQAIFDAERNAAQQRIGLEKSVQDAQVSVLRGSLDAQKQIAQARVDLEAGAREAALAEFRLNEETRIGLFRRTVELERDLANTIINVRLDLARTSASREEQVLKENDANRSRRVQQGFLDQETAARQSAEERLQIEIQNAAREVEIEKDRILAIDRQRQFERAALVGEAQSKIAVLQAEGDARVQQLETNQRLREVDLQGSIRIAKAETIAKIEEIKAQTAAQISAAQTSLALQAATGKLPTAAVTAQQQAIRDIAAASAVQQEAIEKALTQREIAIAEQLVLSRQAVEEAKQATIRESATKQLAIEQQLSQDLIRVDAQTVRARSEEAQRLLQIENRLVDALNSLRQIRPAAIVDVPNLQEALDAVRQLQQRVTGDTQSELTRLQAIYSQFVGRVLQNVQPLFQQANRFIPSDVIAQQLADAGSAVAGFASSGAKLIEVVGNQIKTVFLIPIDGLAQAESALSGFVTRGIGQATALGTALQKALSATLGPAPSLAIQQLAAQAGTAGVRFQILEQDANSVTVAISGILSTGAKISEVVQLSRQAFEQLAASSGQAAGVIGQTVTQSGARIIEFANQTDRAVETVSDRLRDIQVGVDTRPATQQVQQFAGQAAQTPPIPLQMVVKPPDPGSIQAILQAAGQQPIIVRIQLAAENLVRDLQNAIAGVATLAVISLRVQVFAENFAGQVQAILTGLGPLALLPVRMQLTAENLAGQLQTILGGLSSFAVVSLRVVGVDIARQTDEVVRTVSDRLRDIPIGVDTRPANQQIQQFTAQATQTPPIPIRTTIQPPDPGSLQAILQAASQQPLIVRVQLAAENLAAQLQSLLAGLQNLAVLPLRVVGVETVNAAIESIKFLLGADTGGQFNALITALPGKLASIAGAYQAMAQSIIASVNAAVIAIQRLIDLQRSVPSPGIPAAPGAPAPAVPAPAPIPTPAPTAVASVTLPVDITLDGQRVASVIMRIVDGRIESFLQSVPG